MQAGKNKPEKFYHSQKKYGNENWLKVLNSGLRGLLEKSFGNENEMAWE
jgi:hypothetical protein